MQRLLLVAGALLLLAGFLWPWASRIPFGKLPGDLLIDRPGFRLYVPITSMLVVSVVASAILWLFRR